MWAFSLGNDALLRGDLGLFSLGGVGEILLGPPTRAAQVSDSLAELSEKGLRGRGHSRIVECLIESRPRQICYRTLNLGLTPNPAVIASRRVIDRDVAWPLPEFIFSDTEVRRQAAQGVF